jgi:16S rRNA (guanine527-N7)-methyltransferase
MSAGPDSAKNSAQNLNHLLVQAGIRTISESQEAKFSAYLDLILRWNARMNLTAVRAAVDIQSRHFVESIACAQLLPQGIGSVLDFGSGAGFPGIPIAICRPEIAVTLAESQSKKAAFLQEAVRTLGLGSRIFASRAEELAESFGCVTLRAVDHMELAIASASKLVKPGGWLAVLTTHSEFGSVRTAAAERLEWLDPIALPAADQRILAIAKTSSGIE